MRVAIYHNLPPGGALRVLAEFVRRTSGEHEYDLYTVDLGRGDGFAYARDRAEQHDLAPYVARSFRYPVLGPAVSRMVTGRLWLASGPHWLWRAERRIAADIDARGYDVALVHPCQVTQTPSLLRHLSTPSLHYMQEPRRRSFEAGFQAAPPGTALVHRAVRQAQERVLRRRDRAAALAAGRIACNSYYSAESIQRSYGRDAAVCHLGVETKAFDLAADVEVAVRPSVLTVGALEAVKGHDQVVCAVALLPQGVRPTVDLVYERCDERYRAHVETLAASTGVELRLHRGIPDAELARLYRSAAATVLAARLEPFGLVPLESMACGTPVVAVREAGYRETVEDGRSGYLVERSPAALAEGINRILRGDLGCSPGDMRAGVVRDWGWDAAVKRQLELLAATAETRRR